MPLMTQAIQVPTRTWTDLGAGPLTVATRNAEFADVKLVRSDIAPAAAVTDGEPLRSLRFFGGPAHVWALAPVDPVSLIVTAPDAGQADGGLGYATSTAKPVSGSLSAGGLTPSFLPLAGRAFNISLWGSFVASVELRRSFDKGATWLPITASGVQLYAWTAPASESAQEDEVGVLYCLDCTSFVSGLVNYRVSQ